MNQRLSAMIDTSKSDFVQQRASELAEQHRRSISKYNRTQYLKRKPRLLNRDKARQAVSAAVDSQRISKPTICAIDDNVCCGELVAHHHLGYAKAHWLDVVWLCERHDELFDGYNQLLRQVLSHISELRTMVVMSS